MSREFDFTDDDFHQLVDLVHDRTGIVLGDHKRNMVYSRLAKRLRTLKMSAFNEYIGFLQSADGVDEMGNFVNAVTTNLTGFFREKHHFEHLKNDVLMPMNKQPPAGKKLRIWSAGCSSGMEPYSIAMTVRAAIENIASWDVKILATDIDTNMLQRGREGIYPKEVFKDTPAQYLKSWTSPIDVKGNPHLKLSADLRKMIAFNHLNLLETWPIRGQFDVIFCRNVVIYFSKETQRPLFNRYANTLKDDGLLYIGHSESLSNVSDRFALMGKTIYRKIR